MISKHWKYIALVVSLFVTIFTLSAFPKQNPDPLPYPCTELQRAQIPWMCYAPYAISTINGQTATIEIFNAGQHPTVFLCGSNPTLCRFYYDKPQVISDQGFCQDALGPYSGSISCEVDVNYQGVKHLQIIGVEDMRQLEQPLAITGVVPIPTLTPAYIPDPFSPIIVPEVSTDQNQLSIKTLNKEYEINSGTPDSQVRLTGFHFPSRGEIIDAKFIPLFSPNNGVIDATPYSEAFNYTTGTNTKQYFQSDRSGWFDILIAIPRAPAGSYEIEVTVKQIVGNLSGTGSTQFVIKPGIGSKTVLVEVSPIPTTIPSSSSISNAASIDNKCSSEYPDTLICICKDSKWSNCITKPAPTHSPIPIPTIALDNVSGIEISLSKYKVNIDSKNTHTHHLTAHDIYYGPNQLCAEDL